MKYCPECGNNIEGQRFCSNCAYWIEGAKAQLDQDSGNTPFITGTPKVNSFSSTLEKEYTQDQELLHDIPVANRDAVAKITKPLPAAQKQAVELAESFAAQSVVSGETAQPEQNQIKMENGFPPPATSRQPSFGEFSYAPSENASLLHTWKTSIGFSVLGAFVGFPATVLLTLVISTFLATILGLMGASINYESLVIAMGTSIFFAFTIVYAAKFYPSFFTEKPKFKSNRIISFLNFVFGWFIFGLLWNRSLTKKKKGKSRSVFICLTAPFLVYMVVCIVVTLIIGLTSGCATVNRTHADTRIGELQSAQMADTKTFLDRETLTAFDVPASWTAMSAEKGNPFADILFYCEEGDYYVSYGSYDYWNSMSVEERRGLAPSELNMDFYSESEFAEIFAIPEADRIHFSNGHDDFVGYFKYASSGFMDASQGEAWLFRIDNGFVYTLRFVGFGRHYKDEFSIFAGSLQNVAKRQVEAGFLNLRILDPRAPWEQITDGEFPTEITPWFIDTILRSTPYYIPGWNYITVWSRWSILLRGVNPNTYEYETQTFSAEQMMRKEQLELLFSP